MLFYEGSGYGCPRRHQLCKMDTSAYKRHEVRPRNITNDVEEMLGHFEIIKKEIF